MKNLTFAIVLLVFSALVGCSDKNENEMLKGRVNMLLPSNVPVSHIFIFDSITLPDWQKNFNSDEFFKTLFNKVLNSEIIVYDPSAEDTSHIKSTKEDILNRFGQKDVLKNLNEVKSIFFKEEWFLDTLEPMIFEKNVLYWYPVRHYLSDTIEKMKLVFKATGGNPTELLAKNVIYEFNLNDSLNSEFTINIDAQKLSTLILNKVLYGKTKAYDPLDPNKTFSISDINRRMGAAKDTMYVEDVNTGEVKLTIIEVGPMYDQITSLIFVEDWYYDPKTYAIKKVIKGVGPVRSYMKNEEQLKTVVYMMFFGEEKLKIFN